MKRNKQYYIRKAHRWLGVIIGVQFICWTVSGLYFSWTDIDEIHGDHFVQPVQQTARIDGLRLEDNSLHVSELAIRFIDDQPFLWVNDSVLIDPTSGLKRDGVSQQEAESIARKHVKQEYEILSGRLLTAVGDHHEYRGRPLPVWAIHFSNNITAYISQQDGSFQRVRHRSWRWFDFLWMMHTMDYQGRDNFNNVLLRIFSLFGLFTVGSGFVLFFITGKKKRRKNQ